MTPARVSSAGAPRGLDKLRHSEVQKPHVVGMLRQRLEEHVAGLQIAVDDSLDVREGEHAQRLAGDVQRSPERQPSFLDQSLQRLALQQLHHQEQHAVVDSEVRDRNDVGMGQRGQRDRLPLETAAPLRAGGRVLVEHLDRNKSAEVGLPTPVDNARAALAEALQHLVASVQLPPDERIGGIERISDHEPRLYIPKTASTAIEPVGARDTGRLVPEQAEAEWDAHGEDRGLMVPSATTPESAQTWAKERRPQRVTIQFETGGAGGGRGAEGGVRASLELRAAGWRRGFRLEGEVAGINSSVGGCWPPLPTISTRPSSSSVAA